MIQCLLTHNNAVDSKCEISWKWKEDLACDDAKLMSQLNNAAVLYNLQMLIGHLDDSKKFLTDQSDYRLSFFKQITDATNCD